MKATLILPATMYICTQLVSMRGARLIRVFIANLNIKQNAIVLSSQLTSSIPHP